MAKSPDAFRTISEVAEWLGVPAHVLRFWESKFSQVRPIKRAGGRRYYRPADMLLLGGIRKLLHEDGMTIKGVQKMLREKGVAEVAALSQPLDFDSAQSPDGVIDLTRASSARDAQATDITAGAGSGDPEVVPFSPPPVDSTDSTESDKPDAVSGTAPQAAPDPAPGTQLGMDFGPPGPDGYQTGKTTGPAPAPSGHAAVPEEPPAENDISAPEGPLARLARLQRLDTAQAAGLAAIAGELRAWIGRRQATEK